MKIKGMSCPVCCESQFKNVTILREALVAVTTKRLICPLCDEQLFGLDKFTIHLFTHRDTIFTEETIYTIQPAEGSNKCAENDVCHTITIQIPTQSAPENNLQESFEQTNENICNIETITTETDPAASVRCDICNITFSDTNILNMHKNLLHTNGFSCHLCHKRFKMQGSLMVHMRVAHYGFGQPSESNARNVKEIHQHGSSSTTTTSCNIDNKQWECDVCLKKFTTKYFLKKHKRLHTGEMPYVCGLCGKSFTFQQSYHKHMLYHSEDKPHTCTECGRAFKELSTLHNHQRIHSGERPFACETCGKCFRQRVSYLVHKRIHTGAMPYRCTSCDKHFRYKVSQRTHKCKAQPPGSVVRQFGDLVQRLLLQQSSHSASPTNNIERIVDAEETTANNEQYSTVNEECLKQLLYNGNDVS